MTNEQLWIQMAGRTLRTNMADPPVTQTKTYEWFQGSRVIPGTTHLAPPVPAWLHNYLINSKPKPVAKRRVLRKWSNRVVRLRRRLGAMAQAGEDMDSARYWQLHGNVYGTRVLQLGGSLRGRNNR